MQARTVTENFFFPLLNLGDTRIIFCNDAAAQAYGFARAKDLVGRCLSDLQPMWVRTIGQQNWYARHHGIAAPTTFVTIIQRPDGELVGHRRMLVETMAGLHGQSYLTECEVVGCLDQPPAPDLDAHGVTQADVDGFCGRFTVAKLRQMLHAQTLPLPIMETFHTIVARCEQLSTEVFGWQPGMGLDLALRRDLVAWSLDAKAHSLVYFPTHCPGCGWQWNSKAWHRQCPKCRLHLDRQDTTYRQMVRARAGESVADGADVEGGRG